MARSESSVLDVGHRRPSTSDVGHRRPSTPVDDRPAIIADEPRPADAISARSAGPVRGRALTSPATVAGLVGELDLATAPALRSWMTATSTTSTTHVIIDLARVGFLDCSALREFVRARNALMERDLDVRLRSPSPVCLRLLDLAGLMELVLPQDDVDIADHGRRTG